MVGSTDAILCESFIFIQGAAIDRILAEIVHSKKMKTAIDYVLCIGHFLGKVLLTQFLIQVGSSINSLSKKKKKKGSSIIWNILKIFILWCSILMLFKLIDESFRVLF